MLHFPRENDFVEHFTITILIKQFQRFTLKLNANRNKFRRSQSVANKSGICESVEPIQWDIIILNSS